MKKLALLISILVMAVSVPIQASAGSLFEVRKIIKDDYYGEIDGDIYDATTIDELMSMIKDSYTKYMTKEEYEEFNNSIEQQMVGIGVVLDEHEKGVFISEVIQNGPAQSAGLKRGDIISHADGTSLVGMPLNEALTYIKGKVNTTVKLVILREDGSNNELTLIRKTIQMPNIVSSLLAGNVGYIYMTSFSYNGALEVSKAIGALKKQGATSFIFDLQNNGGGYVHTARQVIGLFPNAKSAYLNLDATGSKLVPSDQDTTRYYNKFPAAAQMALLINGDSASASDMTAAAVKDQKLAKIYGSVSFGKGLMQNQLNFTDGSYLIFTIAEFRSPKGAVINRVGVKPDVETRIPIQDAHFDLLKNNLTKYKPLKALSNVPTSKTFTINLTHTPNAKTVQNAVELITLGGQKVTVTTKVSGKKLIIKPATPLEVGTDYVLIVHPTFKNKAGKTVKQGSYSRISVAK